MSNEDIARDIKGTRVVGGIRGEHTIYGAFHTYPTPARTSDVLNPVASQESRVPLGTGFKIILRRKPITPGRTSPPFEGASIQYPIHDTHIITLAIIPPKSL